MIRAQFEHDNIAEAEIVCGIEHSGTSESGVAEEPAPDRSTPDRPQSKLFGSWRRPTWFSLSYSTIRQRYPVRRKPNPFGPETQAQQPFSRLNSLSPDLNRAGEGPSTETALTDATPGTNRGRKAGPKLPSIDFLSQVVPHPPMVAWDDESHMDLPYDNPYYTRSIRNTLWLPRDPFGLLDLDDTVDLRTAITSEPTAGNLGTWLGNVETTSSPLPISDPSSPPLGTPQVPSTPQSHTGSEEIELPAGIARRVQNLSQEDDVEYTHRRRRPSFFRSDSSGIESSMGTPRLTVRRPSGASTLTAFRGRPRASSFLSVMDQSQRGRSQTEVGLRPDMHAQAEFARLNLERTNTSASQLGLGRPSNSPRPPTRGVTTHEALVRELIAEEEEALVDRIKEEQAEAEAATGGTRSWLTSWMYRIHHHHHDHAPTSS
jgi:hypothetical protein